MTWANRSMKGTIRRTSEFLNRRLWAWPIVAVVILLLLGGLVQHRIHRTISDSLESELKTLLAVEVAMLRQWLHAQEDAVSSAASDREIRNLVSTLLAADTTDETPAAAEDPADQLAARLRSTMDTIDSDHFLVCSRSSVIASSLSEAAGRGLPPEVTSRIESVFDGASTVTIPFRSLIPRTNSDGTVQAGVPVMFSLAPVVDDDLQVIAVLGLEIFPEGEFTRLLQIGQAGESGETYAFDRDGRLLSKSRFDDDLILLGLIPDEPHTSSLLQLLVRDPGGDMTRGYRPTLRRADMPLTRMVASAVRDSRGVDVEGYRDYRGVVVVGAWEWLDDYDFGITTELDYTEAYRPLTILNYAFWLLLALLLLSSIAIFVFTVMLSRAQRKAREAAIEARQLGQYKLLDELGAGAMGTVYRGQHAMLRRPTAIKLIDADQVSDASIERFEKEVQITSNLNHPNTIAIYDYGRTPEGVFYYAMEYLDGIDLQDLVGNYGPQPPGRVIHIVRQMCGSLYEAHSLGLVHRDIKPANVMLNRRGAEGDVVKVLDFGLVVAREDLAANGQGAGGLAGTPLYMSPESIQFPGSVDACSDLYSVGAVAYFLLTGRPVFDADDFGELCRRHTSQEPLPPSQVHGANVPADLEDAVLRCLQKNRGKRPQTARELSNLLIRCAASQQWSTDQADSWWDRHERGDTPETPTNTKTVAHDATINFGE